MTEFSYWWTTSGTPSGDQLASYTQAHLARIAAVLAACNGFEGIAPGYLNEMAGTVTGANTVQIATGAAVVDGKVYDSDAAVNVNIPSASGGGNTRIDRIVLRVSWAGFTARVTRIAGTDAATPAAPAITQIPGTTYDLTLCQALVDTSGAVSLTDQRTLAAGGPSSLASNAVTTEKIADANVTLAKMAANSIDSDQYVDGSIDADHLASSAVTTAKIADANVTTAKIADDGVTFAKAGTGVLKANQRQGGNSSDWDVAGATTYALTDIILQMGKHDAGNVSAGSSANYVITFPSAFSSKPIVTCTAYTNSRNVSVIIFGVTTTTVSIKVLNVDSDIAVVDLVWIAIGQG